MKKFWSIVVIVTVLGAGVYGGYQFLKPQDVAAQDSAEGVPTAIIATGTIKELVSATGNVESQRSADLVLAISGQVELVNIEPGEAFAEGDLLVKLDDSTAREQADRSRASYASALMRLEQTKQGPTEGQIAAAEASVASAEASVTAAEANAASAEASLAKLLADPTDEDIRAAQLSIDSAKNSRWSAQAQRDSTKGNPGASDATIDSVEAQVLIAEVAVQQAELTMERLYVAPTAEDVAAAQSAVDSAYASLDQARSSVDQTKASLAQLYEQPRDVDIAVSEASLAETELALAQAEDALEDALLEAPFDGTALDVYVIEGEWLSAGKPVVTVADMEHMELVVLLDEVDVAQVAVGQDVTLYFDALPDAEVSGEVVDIAPSATQTTGGVAFQVTVAFEPGDLPIRLGMTATVDIVVERVADAVLVPNRAVEADRANDQYFVNIKDGATVQRTEIKIGLRDDNYTQVTQGLEPGDVVLLQVIDLGEAETGFTPPMAPGGNRAMGGN